MGSKTGIISAVCISVKRGTRKKPVETAYCREDYGIVDDAHAGPGDRQVSFLSSADIKTMEQLGIKPLPGDFAENIIVDGSLLTEAEPGDLLQVKDGPVFEVTVIGKDCHNSACPIKTQTGTCIMPERGVFTRVITSGELRSGQAVRLVKKERNR
jgi:MOSC domain-containing protein YiiM